jgi:hypothetical protein
VHYHFGGRDGLVDAIVESHRVELDRRRDAGFDRLEEAGDASVESLVRALIEPLAHELDDERGRDFLSIQAQLMLRPSGPPTVPRPLVLRMIRLLGGRDVGGPIGRLVSDFGQLLVFNALARRARAEASGEALAVDRTTFVDELVGAAVRVLDR